MCKLTRESFGVEDISDHEILERLDSSIILIPEYKSEMLGFFSTDIINFQLNGKDLFGIYNAGGVIKKEYQKKVSIQKLGVHFFLMS